MHMALVGVRDGFISVQVSEPSPNVSTACECYNELITRSLEQLR